MKLLETEFVSGVGGFSGADVLTYKQIIRSDKAAVYERSRDGIIKDYETIVIKVNPKGFQIFSGTPLEDDTECYPSTGQWGKKGWSFKSKGAAIARFNDLSNIIHLGDIGNDEDEVTPTETEATPATPGRRGRAPKVRVALNVPTGEFTVKELCELNKVEYQDGMFFINEQIEAGTIKFLREERRNAKGKPSRLFIKI